MRDLFDPSLFAEVYVLFLVIYFLPPPQDGLICDPAAEKIEFSIECITYPKQHTGFSERSEACVCRNESLLGGGGLATLTGGSGGSGGR